MKTLLVTDKTGSAIDILANFIKRENPQHEIDILAFHPKRPDAETVEFLQMNWESYDLIHWMYWKSWVKAKEFVPLIDVADSILSHFNPYDINQQDWHEHDRVVYCTQDQMTRAQTQGKLIRLAVDEQLWTFEPNELKTVGMCANRIEGKKGILEVAQVCQELGLKLILMGRISDRSYFDQVISTGVVEFYGDVPFEQMPEIYHKMGVYVVNSVDGFETGPMPPFEALLSGVPVITRQVGTVGEVLKDAESALFFETPDQLKGILSAVFDEPEYLARIREGGWKTAKNLTSVRFARQYNQLYHETVYPGEPLVSIIMPYTPERMDTRNETLQSLENQSYKNLEAITLVDDTDGYNLARVRNKAIVQASGHYLLFLDDRWKLGSPDTISNFVKQHQDREKIFLWGDKGRGKRNFVENFAFCRRQDFINAGMFNERITMYGGMSQEIRNRLNRQGWEFKFCEGAHAEEKMSSRGKWRRKADIIRAKDLLYKLGM